MNRYLLQQRSTVVHHGPLHIHRHEAPAIPTRTPKPATTAARREAFVDSATRGAGAAVGMAVGAAGVGAAVAVAQGAGGTLTKWWRGR